jgi:hypothetical protein
MPKAGNPFFRVHLFLISEQPFLLKKEYFMRDSKANALSKARTGGVAFIFLCLMNFSVLEPRIARAEINVSNDFSYTYNKLTGAGANQSSLTEGFRFLNLLGVNGNGAGNGFDYNFNIGARFTDDRNTDIQTFLLTHLQAGLTNNVHTLNFGDTFQSFSQYALSTSVKGGSYRFSKESSNLPDLVFIYGFANPRWDNFKGIGQSQDDVLMREVAGGRISRSFFNDLQAGFSVVNSSDHDRISPWDELSDVLSCTLDWEYAPIYGLTIKGESSYSDAVISPTTDEADIKVNGHAHKLTAIGDGGPSRVLLEYERISPEYETVVGFATPDREKIKAKWRYKFLPRQFVSTGFLWYRDNLDDRLAFSTNHYKPEISLMSKRVLGRPYAVTDVSYKLDIARKNIDDISRVNHIVNINYRDRFNIIDADANLGFTSYDATEALREKSIEYLYNTSFSSRFYSDDFILKPSVNLGGWTSDRELENTTDQIYEYALGLGFDIPDKKITSNIKMGHNKLVKDEGEDSSKMFGRMDIYYRPRFLSALDYGALFLRAYVNDYKYDTGGYDFRETSITTGLNIRF